MTRRAGRNVSSIFRGMAPLIGGLCVLAPALLFPARAAAACSSDQFGNAVCGIDIAVPAGQLFSGQVGSYAPTSDWTVAETQIAWGDGTSTAGSDSGGVITGSHVYAAGGSYAITVTTNFNCTAVDALCTARAGQPSAAQGTGSATVAVAPALASAPTATFQVGRPGSFLITSTGTPAAQLSLSGALPAGLAFTDNRDGTGTLSGTPASGTGGDYTLALTASNGFAPDATQSFRLLVQAPPVAAIDAPGSGAAYQRGASVQTRFACSEGPGGSGLASCTDSTGAETVSGGSGHLDTSRPGTHSYTVTATSGDGLTATATISYSVVASAEPTLPAQARPRQRVALSLAPPPRISRAGVRVALACSGGAVGSSCQGRVSLAARIRYVTYAHRRLVARVRRLVLTSAGYIAPSGVDTVLPLHLSALSLHLLAEAPAARLTLHATATLAGGATSHRTLMLQLTQPAAGAARLGVG